LNTLHYFNFNLYLEKNNSKHYWFSVTKINILCIMFKILEFFIRKLFVQLYVILLTCWKPFHDRIISLTEEVCYILLWNITSNTKTDMYNIDLHDITEILLKMALNTKMLNRQARSSLYANTQLRAHRRAENK
jgi:hypothetical protein